MAVAVEAVAPLLAESRRHEAGALARLIAHAWAFVAGARGDWGSAAGMTRDREAAARAILAASAAGESSAVADEIEVLACALSPETGGFEPAATSVLCASALLA